MQTECEQFWQGDFGNDYTARNVNFIENNYQMFSKVFYEDVGDGFLLKYDIKSIIEFGAGSGQNIQALQEIFKGFYPDANYTVLEINNNAIKELQKIIDIEIIPESVSLKPEYFKKIIACKYDLVLCKGILIHIHPDAIQDVYNNIYDASNKYILLCEYYSPERQEILYRGEHNKLWKFDFVKPMLDKGCKILDYGFVSKYDKYFEDDLTWFLFEK
jgi:pseudaminic acid biosynthesis-associated methylase